MQTSWTENLTFEDLLTQMSKELTRQQRRSSSRPAADFLGPGLSSLAIQIGDWNDPITLFNGNYYSEPGALHSPDGAVRWTGSTIAKANGSGMQQVWNTDDLANVHYWMRTYVADGTGQGATFSAWRNFATPSGYVEFDNIDPAYTTSVQDQLDAAAAAIVGILPPLKVYRQTTAPTNPDALGRALMVGDQWLDTDDSEHAYIWDGTAWQDYAGYVLGDLPAQVAAAQAAAEAAADAAADSFDFAVTLTKVYRQTSAPSNPDTAGRALVTNDVWFDSDDDNKAYYWDGAAWTVVGLASVSYADAQAAAAQVAAISAAAADATTKAGAAQSAAISAAAADATTKAAAAQAAAISSAASDATTKANAAQAAAIAAAAADATTKAGNAQSAAIAAAASDATTKAANAQSAAIAAAASDATTKANAAQAAAIAAAAADATTKAGNAQSAAIAAAAADATTKAAAAVASADNYYDTNILTITGSTIQTTATAARGIKLTSSGLIAYNGSGTSTLVINASTGAITMLGDLTSGSTITGAAIVGGSFKTNATASRGIEITTGGMTAYDSGGVAKFTVDASTGAVTLAGALTGSGTITGPTFQTTSTASRGIKIATSGLTAYDSGGTATLVIDASTGAIAMVGSLTSGSTITGAAIVGGSLKTNATASRGVEITSGGIVAYDGAGAPRFTVDGTTGAVTLGGSLTGGGTITGPTFQTDALSLRGIKINSSGLSAYTDGTIGGGPVAGTAMLVINGTTGAITMRGDLTSGSTITGATVVGGSIKTNATAARGVEITSGGITAYNTSGVAQFTVDGSTGAVALAGALTGAGTITGPTFQTSSSANTGIKISSSGLIGYNGTSAVFTLNNSTGAVILTGAISTGSTIDGSIVTGGTLQTTATVTAGIKINSSGLVAYDGANTAKFTVSASTGDVILAGNMTGGGAITGPIFQTTSTASRGVKITSGGLVGYSSAGVSNIIVDASTGNVTILGALTSGSTIDGSTITGGTVQTSASALTGVKLTSGGIVAYGSGVAKFTVDGTTGSVILDGSMTGAGTITGPTFQTGTTGQRFVIDGPGDIINFYSGAVGETAGGIDPSLSGGITALTIYPGYTATVGRRPQIALVAATGAFAASGGTANIGADTITLFGQTDINLTGRTNVTGNLSVSGTGSGAGFDSWQVACTGAVSPNSTTNLTITGFSQAVTVPSTAAVYMVHMDIAWSIAAGTTAIIELLVDGTAQTVQMSYNTSASTDRIDAHKVWRITGLSAGSHTFTARTRNTAAATISIVNATHSLMTITRAA